MNARGIALALLLFGCMDTRSATLGREDVGDEPEPPPSLDESPTSPDSADAPEADTTDGAHAGARNGEDDRSAEDQRGALPDGDGRHDDSRPPRRDGGVHESGRMDPRCRIDPRGCR
jgi:hypothetical protein